MNKQFHRNVEFYKRGLFDQIFFTDKITNQEFRFHKKQIQALELLNDNLTTYVGYGGSARGGKSAIITIDALLCAYAYPECANLIGRKNLTTLWETTWKTLLRMMNNFEFIDGVDYKYNGQRHEMTFSNGSLIIAKNLELRPSDTEATEFGSLEILRAYVDQSEHVSLKIIEKVGERAGSHFTAAEYNLKGKVLEAFNPSGSHVKRRYWTPFKTGKELKTRKFIQALPMDNPGREAIDWVKQKELDFLDGTMSKVEYQKQIKGNFDYDDSKDILCSYDNIAAIFENNHIAKGTEKYITADIARLGSDKAIIAVWQGWNVIEFVTFEVSKTTEIQSAIVALRTKHQIPKHHCVADEDGVGGGVVDNCGIRGFINNSTPLKETTGNSRNAPQYKNLKTQCGYYLAKQINTHQLNIEAEISDSERQEIIEEIEQLRSYKVDDDGKLKLKPKKDIIEDLGRSPDWLDTLHMKAFFDLGKTKPIVNFNIVKEVPKEIKKLPSGMSFENEVCLIDMFLDDNDLYINEVFCTYDVISIVDHLNSIGFDKSKTIISGKEGAIEIRKLIDHGYNCRGVNRTPRLESSGIRNLRGYNVKVTENSLNVISQLENWFFETDEKGDLTDKPEEKSQSCISATLYVLLASAIW